MALKTPGRSVRFQAPGYGGTLQQGRGTHVSTAHNGTLLVRLAADWGGYGTYRRGDTIRVLPTELV